MVDYERQLLKTMLSNEGFFRQISRNIDVNVLFQNKYNRFIYQLMKDYLDQYGQSPNEVIVQDIMTTEYDGTTHKTIVDHFSDVILPTDIEGVNPQYFVDSIFTKQIENMKYSLNDKTKKMDKGQFINYLNKIITMDQRKVNYDISNLWDDICDEERVPIPTNLELIDKYGIAKKEIGLLMAGTGIGKSIFLTYLANEFMMNGYNILHIVFEGQKSSYLKKHRVKMGDPTLTQLKNNPLTKHLKVVQMKSNDTTVNDIESLLLNQIDNDFTPDVLVVDYLDCLVADGLFKENWQSDIVVINELEQLCQKYNVALWSAVQANRSGLNKPLELNNVAGSKLKLDKATMVISLNRDEHQQEHNRASLQILKNRNGNLESSVDCMWNPTEMKIEMPITKLITL